MNEPKSIKRWERRLMVMIAVLALAIMLDLPSLLPSGPTTEPAPATTLTAPATQPLRGEILDATTNEPLVGVRVWLPEYNVATQTNELGTFELVVPGENSGRVKLRASFEGYENLNQDPITGDHQNTYKMSYLNSRPQSQRP